MKKHIKIFLILLFLFGIMYIPQIALAHSADGKYYNKDLVEGLKDYRQVTLFDANTGDEINKPISSMKITANGKSYKDNGSENQVSATVEVGTPITIDFIDSKCAFDIAEVGLQITNGTGNAMDWSELPNGGTWETAYASQYPFAWGAGKFTPRQPGTYKIYGEVRANIPSSQIKYHWDAWSQNGSHGEFADMIAHSSPPAGPLIAYPVKWYFEVVVIEVIPPKAQVKGSFTVRYKDADTCEEIKGVPPVLEKDILIPISGEVPKNADVLSITDYDDNPIRYRSWYGNEGQANEQQDMPCKPTDQPTNQPTNPIPVKMLLKETQKDAFVYYYYKKKAPIMGRINVYQINADTNEIISNKTLDNLDLKTEHTIYNDEITAPNNSTYQGSNMNYDGFKPDASSKQLEATGQTASLSETQKEAWVYFYYKLLVPVTPTPAVTPTPTPTPVPTPSNKPPVAIIQSADKVMKGDDIDIFSNSYDPDGYIAKYEWRADDAKTTITQMGSSTWFDKAGFTSVNLRVTDNLGATDSTSKQIEVLPPMPKAVITYTGKTKENYKITLDSTRSNSPKRYPIDDTKTIWSITAVSGCIDTDIKYLGGLNGISTKEFLVKKTGKIKVTLTITNTAGYSDTTTSYIDISPNLPPIAQFIVPKKSIREYVDANGKRYGETTVYDTSYSPDGDKIIYRKYYCRYDSDNDENFEEEYLDLFYEGNAVQATKRYYSDQGVGWCMYDIEVEEDLMEKDASGKYINTIPEFILPEDIKRVDTFYIK